MGQMESRHWSLLLAGGTPLNCLKTVDKSVPSDCTVPSLQHFERRNPAPWEKLSFSSEIKDWPWGSSTKLLWAVKDPFGHIASCLSLHWIGSQNIEKEGSRHLAAQETQPGNRPPRADQCRTIAEQSYLEVRQAGRGAKAAGFWADGPLSFSSSPVCLAAVK